MPRGDGTGPRGMGPMTGRAAGYCAGQGAPGYMNPIPGGGFGGGGGWRRQYYATGLPARGNFPGYPGPYPPSYPAAQSPYSAPDPALEMRMLQEQALALEAQLNFIRKRLSEIESGTSATE